MISVDRLLVFAAVAFVIIVIRGPSVLFVIGRALAHGRRVALASVVGNATGEFVDAVAVAVGLGAVMERFAAVYLAVKFAGAAYLIFLGIRALRRRHAIAAEADGSSGPRSGLRAAGEGFLVGVTNPKTMIFFAAVLPQFVDRRAGHVPVQMLALAGVFVLIALLSDSMVGLAASAVRSWLARSPRRLGMLGGIGGLAMIGLGVTVAATGRHD